MEHELSREHAGSGITGSITPACSCGWRGWPEYAHNDWQFANLQEQEKEHLNAHSGDKK